MHLIYITFPNKDEAIKVAHEIIKEKLAACANIYANVTSIYEWQGKVRQNEEVTLICKTSDDNVDEIIRSVKRLHSYDCPCIVAIKVEKGNEDFLKWVDNCSKVD